MIMRDPEDYDVCPECGDKGIKSYSGRASDGFEECQACKGTGKKPDDLKEQIAEAIHNEWEDWSINLYKNETLSEDRIKRWRTMWIPYSELSEEVKDYDRKWAIQILSLIQPYYEQKIEQAKRDAKREFMKWIEKHNRKFYDPNSHCKEFYWYTPMDEWQAFIKETGEDK